MAKSWSKFLPTGVALLAVVAVVAVILGLMYPGALEMFSNSSGVPEPVVSEQSMDTPRPADGRGTEFSDSKLTQHKVCDPNEPYTPEASPMPCFPADQLTASDLLPKASDNEWSRSNPRSPGSIENMNHLEAGFHYGINTVGQTLRNANLQLRSEPPNPQVQISPFLQSTIEPDLSRRVLEIGN